MEDASGRRGDLGEMNDAARTQRGEIPGIGEESSNSRKILAAKERKEHRDNYLWRFFYAILAFFAVNSSLVASRSSHAFEAFWGNSTEVPFHEQLMNRLSKSARFANQGKLRYFYVPLTASNDQSRQYAHSSNPQSAITTVPQASRRACRFPRGCGSRSRR